MVDYSKFNTIEGASDSDDEKQTVDPDRAEAWLRKYNELAKDESDSDSDDDEPTIAGVDWAKEGAKQLGPDKYDATLRKRDAKLKNPIPGDATWLTPTERRRLMRHASPGPTGALFAGEQLPSDLKDAEAVPAAILSLKDPWPSVDAAQLYAHARVAKKLDKTCSARLREDLASRTHLRLALARYFVSHQIDATGPTNRGVCEKAIDACWESVREAAAGETAEWNAAWADGPLACAALVLAEPGMRPLQLAEGIKKVGCEVLLALSRREDRRDELIAAWRHIEAGEDAVEVFVEPRGPAPSFLFQPLLQGRVEDHELVPYVSYARHAGLPKYGTLALCLANALRAGIRKFDGARRASALQVLSPALQRVLALEDDDADDIKEWAGFGLGLQNTLRGFLRALTAIGRFFSDDASSSSELLSVIPGNDDLGYEPLTDPIFHHSVDAWFSGKIPVEDGVLAARGDRHGRVLRGWASALRGAAVAAVAAVGADYASVCETPPPESWLGQEVQLALSVRGWLFVKTHVEEGRFTIEFDKGQHMTSQEALPCLHAMRGLVKDAKHGPKGLGEVSLVQARFVLSETRTVTAVALAKGDDDAVATLSDTPADAVVLVDVCDGEHACACCGARASKQVPVKACTGCHRVAYCSRKCQASHWKKGHRKLCPRLRALGVI